MKKRRTYSIRIHSELHNSKRRRNRMNDIGFTGGTLLLKVRIPCKGVSPLYFFNIISFVYVDGFS